MHDRLGMDKLHILDWVPWKISLDVEICIGTGEGRSLEEVAGSPTRQEEMLNLDTVTGRTSTFCNWSFGAGIRKPGFYAPLTTLLPTSTC